MNRVFLFLLAIFLGLAHPFTFPVLSIFLIFGMYGVYWFFSRYQPTWLVFCANLILFSIRFEWFLRPEYHGIAISFAFLFVVFLYSALWTYFIKSFTTEENTRVFLSRVFLFEFIMGYLLCGFTIDQIGIQALALKHVAEKGAFIGGIGLSVLCLYLNVQVYFMFRQKYNMQEHLLALAVALTSFHFLLPEGEKVKPATISLIQTGLKPEEKRLIPGKELSLWPMRKQWEQIFTLLKQTKNSDCIVFPEATVPHFAYAPIYDIDEAIALIKNHFPKNEAEIGRAAKAPFVYSEAFATNAFFFQALSEIYDSAIIAGLCDEREGKSYSSAFCFTPGRTPQIYDKQVLVPVAEAAPLPFLSSISQEYGIQDYFTPGKGGQIFTYKQLKIQVGICYDEMIDRKMSRAKGVNLIATLCNNAWYPSSTLRAKHAATGAMRSIENGVPLVRAGNTGIIGSYFPNGMKREAHYGEWQRGVFTCTPTIGAIDTPYMFWGNFPMLALTMGVIVLDLLRKKRVSISDEPMELTD